MFTYYLITDLTVTKWFCAMLHSMYQKLCTYVLFAILLCSLVTMILPNPFPDPKSKYKKVYIPRRLRRKPSWVEKLFKRWICTMVDKVGLKVEHFLNYALKSTYPTRNKKQTYLRKPATNKYRKNITKDRSYEPGVPITYHPEEQREQGPSQKATQPQASDISDTPENIVSVIEPSDSVSGWTKCSNSELSYSVDFRLYPQGESGNDHIAYTASSQGNTEKTVFDTDSFPIKIDNCCTRTMTPHRRDFVKGSITPVHNKFVSGYGGSLTKITHKGTVAWKVLDDQGTLREIKIPNSFLVPTSNTRLLSPQHMAQELNDNVPTPRGTWCATYGDAISLHWNQRKITKTVNLDSKSSNVGTIWSAPGYKKYHSYCTQVLEPPSTMAYTVELLTDNQLLAEGGMSDEAEDPNDVKGAVQEPGEQEVETTRQHGLTTDFNLNGPMTDVIAQEETETDDAQAEFLRWHQKLSHISMRRIRRMAEAGVLPSRLRTCQIPVCQSCMYGRLTRRAWRTKMPSTRERLAVVSQPGDCVSVDQLESSIPGFMGQVKGKLTRNRYKIATVFVDHFSGIGFIHLQTSTNALETLQAKRAFETFSRTHGVTVKHYHADNGRFAEKIWRNDITNQKQRLTFCGVAAHHQNGKAEKRIRDIQDMARTSLIHANRRWPDAIDARLWPYAIRAANDSINRTPFPDSTRTPLELFSGTEVMPNINDEHPFGCPAYALDGKLQTGIKINKWASRARLAIYLGHSAEHARTVGLLLSLQTGLVSAQFHVRYDDSFETIRDDQHQPKSKWQSLCGFSGEQVSPEELKIPTDQAISHIPQTELPEIGHGMQTTNQLEEDEIDDIIDARQDVAIHPQNQVTRVGRISRAPQRFDDYIAHAVDGPVEACIEYQHPIALATSSDPDVMYLDQAMKQPDRKEFLKAMEKEINAHSDNDNWEVILRSEVPAGHKVLPSVWAMRRKRDISTQRITKWKARLNVHGGKQEKGVNYWETYAPVASWASIRMIMNLAALHGWKTRQLDFVLAFPQAPVETDLYMEVPAGFHVNGDRKKYALKLINNLYGQKQAGRVWNLFLTEGLNRLGFTQSANDPCIYWRKSTLIIIYTDDTIVTGPSSELSDAAIKDIGDMFAITSQPMVTDFLGVRIDKDEETNTITLTQPQLIQSILNDLGLQEASNERRTPALTSKILHSFETSAHHSQPWHYRSVIGKMNYLEKSTRPDIAYAVHQCARFSESPREEHSHAVKLIGRYLKSTKDKGLVCTPNDSSFTCHCDADFAGQWNPMIAEHDGATARSRTGFIIAYSGCPIVWGSRLQTEIALSSTESEYIALSQALREVLPLMSLVQELASAGFTLNCHPPAIHCKVFEDNSGALEMARTPRMRPRTRHINLKYHHFREAVTAGLVSIHAITTDNQIADIFTKPLPHDLFVKFRKQIMGW